MFTSLRSRLLLSYTAVILTILIAVGVALTPLLGVPNQITLEQSAAQFSRLARQLQGRGQGQGQQASFNLNAETLTQLAEREEVRIIWLGEAQQVLLDTQGSWGTAVPTFERISTRQMPHMPASLTSETRANLYTFTDAQGQRWVTLRQPVGSPARPSTLLIALPEPSLRESVSRFWSGPLLRAGAIALVLAMFLAYLIHRSVARPLQQVATAAHAIASGDYNQRVTPNGPREVQTLANSFNQMVEQVQQSQQAQRDFVANVSHDLKTPLTAVQGWSQALLDGTAASPAQQTRAATTIHTEAERMTRLVNQLLDLARLEAGQLPLHPERLPIQPLLGEVYTALSPRAQAQGVQLVADWPEAAVWGMVDGDRLIQVVTNLVDNALKHTPAGGRITLRMAADPPAHLLVQVEDTGAGIPPADLPRIFERFYQVEKSRARGEGHGRASVGLGLAIVRQLAEAHGGTVTAQSELGRGTTFTMRLPTA